jgi:hypothetical protein
MSTADLYEDGFPHGTKEGYDRGCRSSACPNAFDGTTICRDANLRYHGDYAYRKAVDAGETPPEIIPVLKQGPARRAEGVVFAEPTVVVADSAAPGPPADDDEDSLEEAPRRRGRTPRADVTHPSAAMYQRGCRKDNECPSFLAGGISCRRAALDYKKERAAAKRAKSAAEVAPADDFKPSLAEVATGILTRPEPVEPMPPRPDVVATPEPVDEGPNAASALPTSLAALTSDPAVECSVTVMPTGGLVVVIRIPAQIVAA